MELTPSLVIRKMIYLLNFDRNELLHLVRLHPKKQQRSSQLRNASLIGSVTDTLMTMGYENQLFCGSTEVLLK